MVDVYVLLILRGRRTLESVPSAIRSQVAQRLAEMENG